MNPFQWFNNVGLGLWYIADSLVSLHKKVDSLMATWAESVQAWTDFATELQAYGDAQAARADAAEAALQEASDRATAAADQLQAFQDDDAATDAAQLQTQAQQFADDLAAALEAVKNPPTPIPDPPVEPEPLPEEPPVEETPAEEPPTEEPTVQ